MDDCLLSPVGALLCLGSRSGPVGESETQEILPTRACGLWKKKKLLEVDPSVCSQERGLGIRKEQEELHPPWVVQNRP